MTDRGTRDGAGTEENRPFRFRDLICTLLFLGAVYCVVDLGIAFWNHGEVVGAAAPLQSIDLGQLESGAVAVESPYVEIGPHVAFLRAGYFNYYRSNGMRTSRFKPLSRISYDGPHDGKVETLCYPIAARDNPLVKAGDEKGLLHLPSRGRVRVIVVEREPGLGVGNLKGYVKGQRGETALRGPVRGEALAGPEHRCFAKRILQKNFPRVEPAEWVIVLRREPGWSPPTDEVADNTSRMVWDALKAFGLFVLIGLVDALTPPDRTASWDA